MKYLASASSSLLCNSLSNSPALEPGDSGSWVVRNGALVGCVVAGRKLLPIAYMIPASSILRDIAKTFGEAEIAVAGHDLIASLQQKYKQLPPSRTDDSTSAFAPNGESEDARHNGSGLFQDFDIEQAMEAIATSGLWERLATDRTEAPSKLPPVERPESGSDRDLPSTPHVDDDARFIVKKKSSSLLADPPFGIDIEDQITTPRLVPLLSPRGSADDFHLVSPVLVLKI